MEKVTEFSDQVTTYCTVESPEKPPRTDLVPVKQDSTERMNEDINNALAEVGCSVKIIIRF